MSAFDYTRSQATALRLITKFGTSATLMREGAPVGPVYNPEPGTQTELSVTVVFDTYRSDEIDGTLIRRDDLKVLMASGDVVPTVEDRLKDASGNTFSIVQIDALKPGGTVLMWTMQCRG